MFMYNNSKNSFESEQGSSQIKDLDLLKEKELKIINFKVKTKSINSPTQISSYSKVSQTTFYNSNRKLSLQLCSKKSKLKNYLKNNLRINDFSTKLFTSLKTNFDNLKIYNLIIIAILLFSTVNACDIWRAADCIGSTTVAEEELMKSDDYTKEQLYQYCDKGKAYVDCINAKLKCCDLKPELRGALAAYDKQLEKQAWKLGPYCAGLGESNVVKYKCRTTTKGTTTTATKSTKSTMPPCQVEKAGEECTHFLDGRVKFEESWNVYDKMQWCRDTIDYVTCANQYLLNCNISSLKNEADQLQSFIDYVTKASNVHCPGGISGCESNTNDVRCRLGLRYFIGEYNSNKSNRLVLNNLLFTLILFSMLKFKLKLLNS